MYAYHIGPIDFGWQHLKTVAETARELGGLEAELLTHTEKYAIEEPDIAQFLDDWKTAKQMAGEVGWEGDFRHDPVVFWVPCDGMFRYGFAFKQDNNGSTFVVSPVRNPSLDSLK